MASTPEGSLKKDVLAFLDLAGYFYMRMQSGVIRKGARFIHLHPEGTADLLVFASNRIAWVELKAIGQKTLKSRAEKQLAFRNKVLEAGHKHAVCTSVEEVAAFLKEGEAP